MNWNFSKGSKLVVNALIAFFVVYIVPVYFSPPTEMLSLISREKHILYAFCFSVSFLVLGEMIGISDRRLFKISIRHILLYFISALLASVVLVLIVWIFEYSFVGRWAIVKIILSTSFFTFGFTALLSLLIKKYRNKIVLLVSDSKQLQIRKALSQKEEAFEWFQLPDGSKYKVENVCIDQQIDLLVIDESLSSSELDILTLLQNGTRVIGVVDFWERYLDKIPPRDVDRAWLARVDLHVKNFFIRSMKRMLDLIIAVSALIILSPILGIALILIGLESGFPLFYIQARTGYLGKPYSMIKLRTMKDGAEGDGAQWAKKKDSRITKIGKFLRNWRVDEIPQFWNIIMGQMSVVGPRPERPEFQAELKDKVPFWYARNLVKPGLTGWAQIRFSYASDLSESEEKLSYDLYYLKHASFALDMEIILSTLRSVSKGSR
jgi:lipopolysaccharide/colanic/teichoic acid biosynthesis glycosyltransferase